MNKKKKIRHDPFVRTVDTIGDTYTFLITREAFFGARRFDEFAARLRISRARLAERLKHLVEANIFEKRIYPTKPKRYEYHFKPKGLAIYNIALALLEWGDVWRPASDRIILYHRLCGKPLIQKTICVRCGEQVTSEDVLWPERIAFKDNDSTTSNVRGWRKTGKLTDVSDRSDSVAEGLDAIGDRWSLLIMYLALHGPFRFRDAIQNLGIADNILSQRLKHLMEQDLLVRETRSRQSAYVITESGKALLPFFLAGRRWAIDWSAPDDGKWNDLVHKQCGVVLHTRNICTNCSQPILPEEVDIQMPEIVPYRQP